MNQPGILEPSFQTGMSAPLKWELATAFAVNLLGSGQQNRVTIQVKNQINLQAADCSFRKLAATNSRSGSSSNSIVLSPSTP